MQTKCPSSLHSLPGGIKVLCIPEIRPWPIARISRAFVVGYYVHAQPCRTSRLAAQSWNPDQVGSSTDPSRRMSALGL